jgi:two-component sensor histidine kinase
MISGIKYLFFLCAWLACFSVLATSKGPIARFTFNNRSPLDDISGHSARLVGVGFTEDRFGNKNSAAFLSGSIYSYINLGTYKALKPESGTISLWVNMSTVVSSGWGADLNPILLTKYTQLNDYFESYALYYMVGSKRVVAVFSKDSTQQSSTYGQNFSINRWHHLLITNDYNYGSLYIDGKLELRIQKKYKTTFLETDSVMLGSTANKKNSRYFNGSIDDVEFYDRVLTEQEIQALYEAPDPYWLTKLIQKAFWLGAATIGTVLLLYFGIRYRLKKELQKEKLQMELANKILETDLRVNRALMNPHFVFNSLNSLQNFIMSKEYLQANNYLVKFSKLMRKLLESNISNTLGLQQEIELITTYLELEDVRFEKGINYTIDVEPGLIPSKIEIPVMLVQPFIENAIWHGLLKKKGQRLLSISFSGLEDNYIKCVVEDNGIGRKNAGTDNSKKSLATVFVMQRLELINKIRGLHCTLTIEDKPQDQGTIVTILLPISKKTQDVAGHNY